MRPLMSQDIWYLVGTNSQLRVKLPLKANSLPFPQGLRGILPLRLCLFYRQASDSPWETLGVKKVGSKIICYWPFQSKPIIKAQVNILIFKEEREKNVQKWIVIFLTTAPGLYDFWVGAGHLKICASISSHLTVSPCFREILKQNKQSR